MKVNPNVNSGIQSTQTDKAQKSDQASRTDKARQVEKARQDFKAPPSSTNTEISSTAKDAAKAHVVAATTPDVREDRVAELKRKIAEGSYKIDSDAIADKMIREHSAM